jgi:hypothetical protein
LSIFLCAFLSHRNAATPPRAAADKRERIDLSESFFAHAPRWSSTTTSRRDVRLSQHACASRAR